MVFKSNSLPKWLFCFVFASETEKSVNCVLPNGRLWEAFPLQAFLCNAASTGVLVCLHFVFLLYIYYSLMHFLVLPAPFPSFQWRCLCTCICYVVLRHILRGVYVLQMFLQSYDLFSFKNHVLHKPKSFNFVGIQFVQFVTDYAFDTVFEKTLELGRQLGT